MWKNIVHVCVNSYVLSEREKKYFVKREISMSSVCVCVLHVSRNRRNGEAKCKRKEEEEGKKWSWSFGMNIARRWRNDLPFPVRWKLITLTAQRLSLNSSLWRRDDVYLYMYILWAMDQEDIRFYRWQHFYYPRFIFEKNIYMETTKREIHDGPCRRFFFICILHNETKRKYSVRWCKEQRAIGEFINTAKSKWNRT